MLFHAVRVEHSHTVKLIALTQSWAWGVNLKTTRRSTLRARFLSPESVSFLDIGFQERLRQLRENDAGQRALVTFLSRDRDGPILTESARSSHRVSGAHRGGGPSSRVRYRAKTTGSGMTVPWGWGGAGFEK